MSRRWAILVAVAFLGLAGPQIHADICILDPDGATTCEPDPVTVTEDDAWAVLYSQDPALATEAANPVNAEGRSSCFVDYINGIYDCDSTYRRDGERRQACFLDRGVDLIGCVRQRIL
jgi:hypothetical protein